MGDLMNIFSSMWDGTELDTAAVTSLRSAVMTATLPQVNALADSRADAGYIPRQRDRRLAFGDMLKSLTPALDYRGDISLMRGAFEEALRRDRKSTRLNSSHSAKSRMPSSA